MSGLVKGVKKVFKKVVKTVKKIAPVLIIGAAIYFTAGLAAAAIAPGSALAAMPGITGAAQALGIGGAAAAGAGAVPAALGGGITAAAPTIAPAASGGLFSKIGATMGKFFGGGGAAAAGSKAAMTFGDKLLLASVGTQALGALMQPSAKDLARVQAEEQAKFRGAFYGMDAGGPAPSGMPTFKPQPYPGAPTTSSANELLPRTAVKPLSSQSNALPSMAQRMTAPKLLGNIQKQVQGTSDFDLFDNLQIGGMNA